MTGRAKDDEIKRYRPIVHLALGSELHAALRLGDRALLKGEVGG